MEVVNKESSETKDFEYRGRNPDQRIGMFSRAAKPVTRQAIKASVYYSPSGKKKVRKQELRKMKSLMRRRRNANIEKNKRNPKAPLSIKSEASYRLCSAVLKAINEATV